MKKKVNVFGKSIPVLAIFVLGIALVSAALVPYLTGLAIFGTVTVDSPMKLTMDRITKGTFDNTAGTFDVGILHGGEEFALTTTLSNQGEELTGLLTEVKVADFDGVGITYFHSDCQEDEVLYTNCWEGDIPVCTITEGGITDAYYYIGPDTAEVRGFTFPSSYSEESTAIITADLYLAPGIYNAEIGVIKAVDRVCGGP